MHYLVMKYRSYKKEIELGDLKKKKMNHFSFFNFKITKYS